MARTHGETAQAYAQRRAFEAERKLYIHKPGPPIELPILCSCLSFRYSHPLSAHRRLKHEGDWPTFEQREARERASSWQEWDTSTR